jgi:hypothetical protein
MLTTSYDEHRRLGAAAEPVSNIGTRQFGQLGGAQGICVHDGRASTPSAFRALVTRLIFRHPYFVFRVRITSFAIRY